VIIYPQQAFEVRASGKDTAGIPIQFQLAALRWEYVGKGEWVDSLGKFQAIGAGRGLLIGSYQGLSDTIFVEIINWGTHMIDDFNSV